MTLGFASFLLAGLLAVALAPPAEPTPPPPEEMTYTIPPGWERSEKDRLVVLTPPGVAADKCSLVVTPGETLKGEFSTWFKDRWDALRQAAKVVQGGGRTGNKGPDGSSFLVQAGLLESAAEDGARKTTGLLLYAVHIGDGVHWVVFRTDGAALFNEHKKAVNTFLAGMKVARTEEAPAAKPARPKKPAPPVKPRQVDRGSRN